MELFKTQMEYEIQKHVMMGIQMMLMTVLILVHYQLVEMELLKSMD